MEILPAVIEAIFSVLKWFFGRSQTSKDPEKEALQDALKAKEEDASALAAPPRSDADLDRLVHEHWRDNG